MAGRGKIRGAAEAPREQSAGKSKFPFARAYDLILSDAELSAAEKLVMIQTCRYWPAPCMMTAETIAQRCGLDSRYVRRLIKGLCQGTEKRKGQGKPPRRAYLRRQWEQAYKNGRTTTFRLLVPLCFGPDDDAPGGAAGAPIGPGGSAPKPTPSAPPGPPNRNGSRNENRKEIERDASPLPAGGQASASRTTPAPEYASNRMLLKEPTEEEKRAGRAAAERELARIGAHLAGGPGQNAGGANSARTKGQAGNGAGTNTTGMKDTQL